MTKSEVDRLGERLRKSEPNEDDLRLLDQYRRSFTETYAEVVETIRNRLGYHGTGRPAKSTISIVEKLKRESIRLSQMQDISGCRLVVSASGEQRRAVADLTQVFQRSRSLTGASAQVMDTARCTLSPQ